MVQEEREYGKNKIDTSRNLSRIPSLVKKDNLNDVQIYQYHRLDDDGDRGKAIKSSMNDTEGIEIEKFTCILEYYNLWAPLPDTNRLRFIRIQLLPKIQVKY